MEIQGIISLVLSVLAIITSIVAMIISIRLGQKSNYIALYEHQYKVFHVIEVSFKRFKVLKDIEGLLTIKENNPFNELLKNPDYKLWQGICILLNLKNNIVEALSIMDNEINFIKHNVYTLGDNQILFNSFISLYINFFQSFKENLEKDNSNILRECAINLGVFCDCNQESLYDILKIIQKKLL